MTALADALTAAQTRAVAALSKSFVHTSGDDEAVAERAQLFRESLDEIGLTDKVEQEQLLAALAIIRAFGGEMPTTANGEKPPEKMTPAQRSLIERLVQEKGVTPPDLEQRTKQEAHEIIDTLKAGTYDPAKWRVPF